MNPTAPGVSFPSYCFRSCFLFAFVPNVSDLIRLSTHIKNPSTFCLSPYRQGLDNPLFALGAEICFLVCRGWTRGGARTSFWFDTLVLNWGKYFSACYIILSASGKSQRETSNHQEVFLAPLPGRLLHHPPGSNLQISSLRTYIICHLPPVFLSPTSPFASRFPLSPFTNLPVLFASLFRSPFFSQDLF